MAYPTNRLPIPLSVQSTGPRHCQPRPRSARLRPFDCRTPVKTCYMGTSLVRVPRRGLGFEAFVRFYRARCSGQTPIFGGPGQCREAFSPRNQLSNLVSGPETQVRIMDIVIMRGTELGIVVPSADCDLQHAMCSRSPRFGTLRL